MIGNTLVYHITHADELAIFPPSRANMCPNYGINFDVKYNAKKSVIMICKNKEDKDLEFPDFYLSEHVISVVDKTKYLGHFITNQMTDDDDVYRQRRVLYAQG